MYRSFLCGLFLTATLMLSPIAPGVGLVQKPGETPFTLTPVVSGGLSKPDFVTNAGDGSNRLFIVEQTGKILILPPGATAPLPTPFLDISTKIACCDERGLLGLAFHPQYAANGRFFVDYTRAEDGAIVIAEFRATADPNVASPQESVVLIIPHPASNHNGGNIAFGPDEFLYIGTGDGGGANDPDNRAQNIEDLLGKIVRIDINTPNGAVLYSSPSTNPYVGVAGRDEIYAIGLRNPFRWSFDRATGELYAGDVGQDAMEEIDLINLGGNYGWRVWEATRCRTWPRSLHPGGIHATNSRVRARRWSMLDHRRVCVSRVARDASAGNLSVWGFLLGRNFHLEQGDRPQYA
jgi:glucose/arabinose dehydrogenase